MNAESPMLSTTGMLTLVTFVPVKALFPIFLTPGIITLSTAVPSKACLPMVSTEAGKLNISGRGTFCMA